MKAIRVQVNGRSVESITPDIGAGGLAGEQTFDVPLAKGRNDVRVTLANATGEKTETLVLNHEGEGDLDKRGTLYILAIGVDRYPPWATPAATARRAAICALPAPTPRLGGCRRAAARAGHTKVVKQVLVNGAGDKDAPTAANITDAIDALRQSGLPQHIDGIGDVVGGGRVLVAGAVDQHLLDHLDVAGSRAAARQHPPRRAHRRRQSAGRSSASRCRRCCPWRDTCRRQWPGCRACRACRGRRHPRDRASAPRPSRRWRWRA